MAYNAFLKIDGVLGDSADKFHAREIALVSFSWGAVQPSRGSGGGKVAIQDFRFSAALGIASPLLMIACATGQHFATATLSVRKAGESPADYAKIVLTDALVTSFQTGSTPTDAGTYSPLIAAQDSPLDEFTLSFAKIDFQVAPVDSRGALGTPIKSSFNVATNSKA